MSYIINPSEFGINEDCRLCIKNMQTNEFEDLVIIKRDQQYNFINKFKKANTINYKFKFQIKSKENKWVNETGYYAFLNYFPVNIERFWLGRAKYSRKETENMIDFYLQYIGVESYEYVINAFNHVTNQIEKAPISDLVNIKYYLEYVEKIDFNIPRFWRNINLYLKHIYLLRTKIIDFKLGGKTYLELMDDKDLYNVKFKNFLKSEIKVLKEYKLEFTDFLAGRYYSFFGKRDEAADLFKNYLTLDNNILNTIHMSRGITTYFNIEDEYANENILSRPVMLENVYSVNKQTTILMSVDPHFLRKYGPQLFASIVSLKSYHFHFNVIGNNDDIENIVQESRNLIKNMIEFYKPKVDVVPPTFSIENIPDYVKQHTTYFACSRFLHADFFMNKFTSNILVLDADYTILDDFDAFLKKIEKLDIGMSIRNSRACMAPWTRYMGGSVFFKNNNNGRRYVKHLQDYILRGLKIENSWILDQNALCYATERVLNENPEFNISNIPYDIKPFKQTRIRYYIEEILPK